MKLIAVRRGAALVEGKCGEAWAEGAQLRPRGPRGPLGILWSTV